MHCSRRTLTGRKWTVTISVVFVVLMASDSRAACTVSASGVNFGVYNVFSPSPTDSTGTITVDCGPRDVNVSVSLSTGQSGIYSPRTMRKGTESLSYNLFRDPARTSIWGNGTSGTQQYTDTRPGPQTIVLTIYGRVFPGADVTAGSYTDTVSAVINF
jgi:spore coat protein U-like protein